MADLTTPPAPGTPTQVAHPGRTTLRTIIQTAIPVILGFVVIAPEIIQAVLSEPSLPDNLRLGLAGVAAGIVAVAGIIARIMAIPGVEKALQKIGVGTGVEKEDTPVAPVTDFDGPNDPGVLPEDGSGLHRGPYLGN